MAAKPKTKKAGKKAPKSEAIGIRSRLRHVHQWFETLIEKVKQKAVEERRKKERLNGPFIVPNELMHLADELEEIQRQMNALEVRREPILKSILAHWGHTGIEEIKSPLGNTLISTSFEIGVDSTAIEKETGESMWENITERMINPHKLLAEGRNAPKLQKAIENAAIVKKLKVSVTSPSSRRPKSGESGSDTENEEE